MFSSVKSFAQSDSIKNDTMYRPMQVTFITPMGTNGIDSWKVKNRLSINILAGYTGGLNGLELGSLANTDKGDVYGTQLAGFCNTNFGKTIGCQMAGFSNVSLKYVRGLQAAGFCNVVKDSVNGCQLAGFVNYAHDSSNVVQMAGFANVVKGNLKGAQLAGFANHANGDVEGLQAAGFSNTTYGNTKGMQMSGFANITTKDLNGTQLSGFLNYARKVRGAQIGVFNVCDTIEKGFAMGVFSFVRKGGYRAIEIGGDETFYAQVSVKIGIKKFYNILSAGAKIKDNSFVWGWGYGFGTMANISKGVKLNIEGVQYVMSHDDWWVDNLNLLSKVKANVTFRINDYVSIYVGPSYNMLTTDRLDKNGELKDDTIAPWSNYKKKIRNTMWVLYPGFSVGLIVKL